MNNYVYVCTYNNTTICLYLFVWSFSMFCVLRSHAALEIIFKGWQVCVSSLFRHQVRAFSSTNLRFSSFLLLTTRVYLFFSALEWHFDQEIDLCLPSYRMSLRRGHFFLFIGITAVRSTARTKSFRYFFIYTLMINENPFCFKRNIVVMDTQVNFQSCKKAPFFLLLVIPTWSLERCLGEKFWKEIVIGDSWKTSKCWSRHRNPSPCKNHTTHTDAHNRENTQVFLKRMFLYVVMV